MRVLDTDTCVEILRGNEAVIEKRREINDDVVTTWINAAELYFGAARSPSPETNRVLVERFLDSLTVLDLDRQAASFFGKAKADLLSSGRPLPDADILIASIVLAADAILVTGNERHFERFSVLRLENWIR